jgi:hypothetical protein
MGCEGGGEIDSEWTARKRGRASARLFQQSKCPTQAKRELEWATGQILFDSRRLIGNDLTQRLLQGAACVARTCPEPSRMGPSPAWVGTDGYGVDATAQRNSAARGRCLLLIIYDCHSERRSRRNLLCSCGADTPVREGSASPVLTGEIQDIRNVTGFPFRPHRGRYKFGLRPVCPGFPPKYQ